MGQGWAVEREAGEGGAHRGYTCERAGSEASGESAATGATEKAGRQMTADEMEAWFDSYSMGFVDRAGRPVKNRDAEKLLADGEYRMVAKDELTIDGKAVLVSTVFLALPHIGLSTDEPLTYETMIFGGAHDDWQHRWKNAAIASKAHERIVKALREGDELPFGDENILAAFLKQFETEEGD